MTLFWDAWHYVRFDKVVLNDIFGIWHYDYYDNVILNGIFWHFTV